ncbi:hypothetical protein J2X66_003794 [Pseudomonas sp. 3296]|uniref:hypothetical protein n=1 Tax=Pseudomonas sp. 3296 TaxID=2817753 RepID=UPI002857B55A|nr:hypothetical protein [Pseudomonas sp. 3296]MDR6916920.1 hypothetical protein [Pseudomonas sp. 3296]
MEEQYSVFINAGAVVMLSRDLAEQEQQDVLHSVLLAQLVATRKYPEFTLGDGWYDTCHGVLKDSWLQRAVAWDSFGLDDTSKRAMVEWVESQLDDPSDSMTVARGVCVFNDIARLPCDHPAIELLRGQMLRQRTTELADGSVDAVCDVRLQIIVVRQGAVMNSLFVEFTTTALASTHPLDCLFRPENVLGNIRLRWFQANLSPVLYASLREAIVKKLGGKAAENILRIIDDKPARLPPKTQEPS